MPDRNRIIHLVAHDGNWEPFARIASLAAALREFGFHSLVAAPSHSRLWEFAEAAGVETIEFTLENSINPLRWKELGDLIKRSDAGLVHLHDGASAKLLSRARLFAGGPAVVATRYESGTGLGGADFGGGITRVACPSAAMAKEYESRGAPADKLAVVYAGVSIAMAERADAERDVLRAQFRRQCCPAKEKPLFVINIAPLEPASRQMEILEALPDILAVRPQTHLILMGEGSLHDELLRRRKILALDGDVSVIEPDKAFHRLLAAGDVYVALTGNDGAGLMAQAAMAAGRAVLAAPEGCYGELLEDGKSGEFAAPEELKDKLLDLLQNRTRREHLGRLGRARATKLFSMPDKAGEMAELYKSLNPL